MNPRRRPSWILPLVVALSLLGSSAALAQEADIKPPVVEHVPLETAVAGTHLEISARVTDDVEVMLVFLYVRARGTQNYYAFRMDPREGRYVAFVPPVLVQPGGLEYFIEAKDRAGNVTTTPAVNAEENPYRIRVTPPLAPEPEVAPPAERFRSRMEVRLDGTLRHMRGADGSLDSGRTFDGRFIGDWDWGPLSASLLLRNDDPAFTGDPSAQPTNRFLLEYRSRLFALGVGDVTATLTDLSIKDETLRGFDARLQLGPVSGRVASGMAERRTSQVWGRRVRMLQAGLETSSLHARVSVGQLLDQWDEGISIATAPEQNYLAGIDFGVSFGRVKVGADVVGSLYFDNAVGRLWPAIDDVRDRIDDIGLPGLEEVINFTDRVPDWIKEQYLPFPNFLDLSNLPRMSVDVGAKATLKTPLPLSDLEASYFRYGSDFVTLAGIGVRDSEGYTLTWRSQGQLMESLSLGLNYERSKDGVPSLLELTGVTSPPPDPQPRTERQKVGGTAGYRLPNRAMLEFRFEQDETRPEGTGSAERTLTVHRYGIRGVPYRLGDLSGRINATYMTATQQNHVDPSKDKHAVTYRVDGWIDRGAWSHRLALGLKTEVDASSVRVDSPTVALSTRWTSPDPRWLGWEFYNLEVRAGVSYATSRGTNGVDVSNLTTDLAITLGIAPGHSVVLAAEHHTITDLLDAAESGVETNVTIGYRLRW